MIVGSGIDLVEIRRIQQSMDRHGRRFLDRVYTALGTGISYGVSWLEIEVVREPSGRPTLRFHGRAAQIATVLGVARAALSITHTADLAMASVVIEK
jgi:holo-[acyl-carrier protein] synthase